MSSPIHPVPVLRLFLLALIATLAGFLLGVDLAVVNGTVLALTHAFGSGSAGSGVGNALAFGISIALLGSAVGALGAGELADRFGRKPMMLATAAVFIVATWGVGAAHTVTVFSIYRLLGGIAAGAGSVVTPAYLAEIAPPRLRGRLIIVQQMAIVVGIMLTFLSNYLIAHLAGGTEAPWLWGHAAWRWMFWAGLIPSVGYLLSAFVVPESPRFLVSREREEAARRVMRRLWGASVDLDAMVTEIRTTVRRGHAPRWRDLTVGGAGRRLLPIVWLGIGLGFCQQSNGINVVLYYGEVLWKTVGFTEERALFINVLMGTALILATCTSMALIDRVGRRPILLVGSICMILTLGTMTAVFSASRVSAGGAVTLTPALALAGLVAAHLFIFSYGASWAPVTWVLLGEMFPNRIRGGGIAMGGAMVWLTNFVVTLTFPALLRGIGLTRSYGLYTGFTIASLFFILKWVRETKGIKLEEMSGEHLA